MTLVLVETADGAVTETSLEALSFARGLGTPVSAVLIDPVNTDDTDGTGVALTDRLGEYGVARMLRVAGPAFEAYAAAAWAAAVVAAARSIEDGST
ncbi:MAG: hypothetical protein ACRDPB_03445, partial [Nocardioidaceae bacterium]